MVKLSESQQLGPVAVGRLAEEGTLSLSGLHYADVAEIRAVFCERRRDLWLEFVGNSKLAFSELNATREKLYSEMFEMSPIGRCNRILKAVEDVEDTIKAALG